MTLALILTAATLANVPLVAQSATWPQWRCRYNVADSETWAVPVLLPDGLIVRDATGIMRLVGHV